MVTISVTVPLWEARDTVVRRLASRHALCLARPRMTRALRKPTISALALAACASPTPTLPRAPHPIASARAGAHAPGQAVREGGLGTFLRRMHPKASRVLVVAARSTSLAAELRASGHTVDVLSIERAETACAEDDDDRVVVFDLDVVRQETPLGKPCGLGFVMFRRIEPRPTASRARFWAPRADGRFDVYACDCSPQTASASAELHDALLWPVERHITPIDLHATTAARDAIVSGYLVRLDDGNLAIDVPTSLYWPTRVLLRGARAFALVEPLVPPFGAIVSTRAARNDATLERRLDSTLYRILGATDTGFATMHFSPVIVSLRGDLTFVGEVARGVTPWEGEPVPPSLSTVADGGRLFVLEVREIVDHIDRAEWLQHDKAYEHHLVIATHAFRAGNRERGLVAIDSAVVALASRLGPLVDGAVAATRPAGIAVAIRRAKEQSNDDEGYLAALVHELRATDGADASAVLRGRGPTRLLRDLERAVAGDALDRLQALTRQGDPERALRAARFWFRASHAWSGHGPQHARLVAQFGRDLTDALEDPDSW
jgi:hypothetical protein